MLSDTLLTQPVSTAQFLLLPMIFLKKKQGLSFQKNILLELVQPLPAMIRTDVRNANILNIIRYLVSIKRQCYFLRSIVKFALYPNLVS